GSASDRRVSGISADALDLLTAYDWPGNIRQLENAVFRALVLSDGDVLTAEEFPQIRAQVEGIDESQLAAAEERVPPPTKRVPLEAGKATAERQPLHPGLLRTLGEDGHVRALESVEKDVIRFAV